MLVRDVLVVVRQRSFVLVCLLLPALPALYSLVAIGSSPELHLQDRVALVDTTGTLAPLVGAFSAGTRLDVVEVLGEATPDDVARLDGAVRSRALAGWVELGPDTRERGDFVWHGGSDSGVVRAFEHVLASAVAAEGADVDLARREADRWNRPDAMVEVDAVGVDLEALIGPMALLGVLWGAAYTAAARVLLEDQKGLVDLQTCIVDPLSLALGKSAGAMVIAVYAMALMSVLPGAAWVVGALWMHPSTGLALPQLGGSAAVWSTLLGLGLVALVLPAVSFAVARRTPVPRWPRVLVGFVSFYGLQVAIAAPGSWMVRAASYVPGVGVPFLFLRWTGGAPLWEVLGVAIVGALSAVAVSVAGVRLGRGLRALGRAPTTPAELLAAWQIG